MMMSFTKNNHALGAQCDISHTNVLPISAGWPCLLTGPLQCLAKHPDIVCVRIMYLGAKISKSIMAV